MSRRRDERGTFLVLWALMTAAVMTMVAVVVDLGDERSTRRSLQSVADLAALAAGDKISTADGSNPYGACVDAVTYLNDNLPHLTTTIDASDFCAQPGKDDVSQTYCSTGSADHTPAQPTTLVGEYTVSLHYPVPADEIVDAATGPRTKDGNACERLRVIVSRDSPSFFAGVIGQSRLRMSASATIRRLPPSATEIPALWLLDPYGCTSLNITGGAKVTVGTDLIKGLVTVDSDGSDSGSGGSCTGNSVTLDASGNGSLLTALPSGGATPGQISLYAMPEDATVCRSGGVHDCDPSDIGTLVNPQPIRRGTRATRAPVDWRYDCRTGYAPYPRYSTSLGQIDIADCPKADPTKPGYRPPYMSHLKAALNPDPVNDAPPNLDWVANTTTIANPTAKWNKYTGPCTVNGGPLVFTTGNWYVDCGKSGLDIKRNVTFAGGNVVILGGVSVGSGATLTIAGDPTHQLSNGCVIDFCANESSLGAAFLYVRGGHLSVSSGSNLTLAHTVVVQENGDFNFQAGGTPTWTAPTEGPFKSLAFWNETPTSNFLSGGSLMSLSGVFFTPEAMPFSIAGGAAGAQQDAQFVSRQVKISGNTNLWLSPQGTDPVTLPPPVAFLIR